MVAVKRVRLAKHKTAESAMAAMDQFATATTAVLVTDVRSATVIQAIHARTATLAAMMGKESHALTATTAATQGNRAA